MLVEAYSYLEYSWAVFVPFYNWLGFINRISEKAGSRAYQFVDVIKKTMFFLK